MFRVFGRSRTTPDDPYRLLSYLPVQLLPAGVHLTMDTALQISVVWACVDAIAKAIATSPILIRTRDARGRYQNLPNDSLSYIVNVRPNADMTAIGFREAMMFSALTWGNAYAEIERDGAGRVAALQFLLPDRMMPRRLPREQGFRLVYDYENPDGSHTTLEARDVLHVHGPGISGLMGDNIVARAARAMGVAAAQERFAGTYFGNNAVIGGWIEYPRVLGDTGRANLLKGWEARHKGPDKAHKTAVLENGAKFHQLEVSAESSQMIAARQFQLPEICRYYGVPPHKVFDLSRSTNNNIEHQGIEWVRDGLSPWGARWEQELAYKCFAPRSLTREILIDLGWLQHGDAKSRAETMQIYANTGVYSINEVRAKLGENDIGPDGDRRIIPLNMQTLEQVELAEEKAELELEQLEANAKQPATEEANEPGAGADPPLEQDAITADHSRRLIRSAAAEILVSVFARYRAGRSSLNADETRPWLLEESRHALELARALGARPDELEILHAADAVDSGVPPAQVAAQIVARMFPPRSIAGGPPS